MYENNNQYPYNGENFNQNMNQPPTNKSGKSIASMVIGIVSLALSVLCCGGILSPITIISSIVGIVLGNLGLKESPNNSKAKAGMVLSIIAIIIAVIMVTVNIILVATGFTEGLMEELLSQLELY